VRLHASGGVGVNAEVAGEWWADCRRAGLGVDLDRSARCSRLA
jgi:hypothetical protein